MDAAIKEFQRRFGARLQALLEQRALSQGMVERMTGIKKNSVSRMTAGNQRPYLDQALAIACACDVPLEWLVSGEGEVPARADPYELLIRKLAVEIGWDEVYWRAVGARIVGAAEGQAQQAQRQAEIRDSAKMLDAQIKGAVPVVPVPVSRGQKTAITPTVEDRTDPQPGPNSEAGEKEKKPKASRKSQR